MTESSTKHLPPACPEWCISDHSRDLAMNALDLDEPIWFHRGPTILTMPTGDGMRGVVLERVDGVVHEPGRDAGWHEGVRLNFDYFDMSIDEAERLATQLLEVIGELRAAGIPTTA